MVLVALWNFIAQVGVFRSFLFRFFFLILSDQVPISDFLECQHIYLGSKLLETVKILEQKVLFAITDVCH